MTRRKRLLIGLVVVAAIAATTMWMRHSPSQPSVASRKPDVLLVTLDTTRADRIGAYGYKAAVTPHLDRLAAGGVRFEQAVTSAPLTLPAHASLMTARQPYAHGVRNNGYFMLASDVPTLAEAFAAAGYDTAAFVSAFVLDRQFGLAKGFSHYDDTLDRGTGEGSSLESERRGDRTVDAALRWMTERDAPRRDSGDAPRPGSGQARRPFFLWVHLFDPHDPYTPPPPFRERFAGAPYDGEIAFADALLGTLLEKASNTASTLVAVAGDHGESLGEHGESTHGLFVYEGVLRVPLIMSGAGIPGPAVITEPVPLIDVAPTIADLAGIGGLAGAEGRSLRPLFGGNSARKHAPALYAETYFPQFFMGWAPLRSLSDGRWKFIDAPNPELYDLATDAAESINLIDRQPARAAALQRALRAAVAGHANMMTPTTMSNEARERLASLGYVSAGATPSADGPVRGADPKHMVGVFEQLLAGNRALSRGDAAAAAAIAREVVRKDAANAFAHLLDGRAALAEDRNREAIAAFKAYVALVPQSADAHHWMALAYLRLGDRARALAEEEAALALDPRHSSAAALRAGLLFSTGRADEGIASLRDAVARDPSNHRLVLELADLLTDAQKYQEAEAEYRRVVTAEPTNSRAHAGLGVVLAAADRMDVALESLTRAVAIDGRNEEARLARAEVLARLRRTDEARAELQHLARSAARPDIRAAARKALQSSDFRAHSQ
jgi:arylsulfatase A-like enzyme/Tfp pilus assembly protein PilF